MRKPQKYFMNKDGTISPIGFPWWKIAHAQCRAWVAYNTRNPRMTFEARTMGDALNAFENRSEKWLQA
jgi:hypothetical protein